MTDVLRSPTYASIPNRNFDIGNQSAGQSALSLTGGYQGTSFHGGVEYRLHVIEFRGGMGYGLDRWHPTAGVGLNLGSVLSIDTAVLWNTTNIAREHRPGFAVSLRLNGPQPYDY